MKVSTIRKTLLALSLGLGASYMSIAATESSALRSVNLTATVSVQDDGLDPDKTPPVQSLATFLNKMNSNNSQPAEQHDIPLARLIELHVLNLGFL